MADTQNFQIKDYFQLTISEQKSWLAKIGDADWRAGKYLFQLLSDGQFKKLCGEKSKVFLLTQGDKLISFCSFAEHDNIPDTKLTPWIGFVYTFPAFRGKRRIGKLIEHIYDLAKAQGFKQLYISTDQKGLYENFGFSFLQIMTDCWGGETLVYQMKIENKDYRDIIGKKCKRHNRPASWLSSSTTQRNDLPDKLRLCGRRFCRRWSRTGRLCFWHRQATANF